MAEVGDCCICKDPLVGASATLSCAHEFHFDCLSKWRAFGNMNQAFTCPMCRHEEPFSFLAPSSDFMLVSGAFFQMIPLSSLPEDDTEEDDEDDEDESDFEIEIQVPELQAPLPRNASLSDRLLHWFFR